MQSRQSDSNLFYGLRLSYMKNAFFLGIDIGGTKCIVLAGSEDMTIYERIQFPTETNRGPDYAINKLLGCCSNYSE